MKSYLFEKQYLWTSNRAQEPKVMANLTSVGFMNLFVMMFTLEF